MLLAASSCANNLSKVPSQQQIQRQLHRPAFVKTLYCLIVYISLDYDHDTTIPRHNAMHVQDKLCFLWCSTHRKPVRLHCETHQMMSTALMPLPGSWSFAHVKPVPPFLSAKKAYCVISYKPTSTKGLVSKQSFGTTCTRALTVIHF